MTSMTFGTLPTREEFNQAFERECSDGYRIRLGSSDSRAVDGFKLGDGTFTADELWTAVSEICSFSGHAITVSEDDEFENVYQAFYADSDGAFIEVGPDAETIIVWAQKFSTDLISSEHRAIECLNYACAYGETGKCFERHETAMNLVSGIMDTLGFEWI